MPRARPRQKKLARKTSGTSRSGNFCCEIMHLIFGMATSAVMQPLDLF